MIRPHTPDSFATHMAIYETLPEKIPLAAGAAISPAEDISPILSSFPWTTSHSLHELATASNYLIKILLNSSPRQKKPGFRNMICSGIKTVLERWRNPAPDSHLPKGGKNSPGKIESGAQIKESGRGESIGRVN